MLRLCFEWHEERAKISAEYRTQGALSCRKSLRKFKALKAEPRPLSAAGSDMRVLLSLRDAELINTVL